MRKMSNRSKKPIFVDLFCGAGGLSSGLCDAGFVPLLAVDFDKHALDSYKRNHPETVSLNEDITQLNAERISEYCGGKEIDLIAGGPSCQGYSTHGKRDESDPRNFLFKHFIRLVGELRPRWVIMENVKGLLTYQKGMFEKAIQDSFDSIGYTVSSQVLCAADFGVPQLRKRIIFLATRLNVPITFPIPTYQPQSEDFLIGLPLYTTVRQALDDLPLLKGNYHKPMWNYAHDPANAYQAYVRGKSEHVTLHHSHSLSAQSQHLAKFIKQGQGVRAVPLEELPARFKKMRRISNGNFRRDCTTLYYRIHMDRPAYTITCNFRNIASGPFLHPLEDRCLSFREAARLMSFKDDYDFNPTGLARQIGNAVPPLLAKAVGQHILKLDQDHIQDDTRVKNTTSKAKTEYALLHS